MISSPNSEVSLLKRMIDNHWHNKEVYKRIQKLYTQKLNSQTICKKLPETSANQVLQTPLAHQEVASTCQPKTYVSNFQF